MRILLPPSEGKAVGRRGRPYDPAALSFPALAAMRHDVRAALERVSARPDAATVLGVGRAVEHEIARNLALSEAASLAARDTYTGVLFDALSVADLSPEARRRASRWVVIFSALYGAVRLSDRIGAYRVSMGVDLPSIGPLAAAWRPHLAAALDGEMGRGLIVDCRSAAYGAAWSPKGGVADRWVQVRVPGASHMAKRTRGLVAREVLERGLDPRDPAELAEHLADVFDDVVVTPPVRAGRAWVMDVAPA